MNTQLMRVDQHRPMTKQEAKSARRAIRKARRAKREPLSSSVGNTVDRLIGVFNPGLAARRMYHRRVAELANARLQNLGSNGWSGARHTDIRDHRYLGGNHDIDTFMETDIAELQSRCFELVRDDMTAHAAVETRVTNEVGVGIQCQARCKPMDGVVSKELADQINDIINGQMEQWSDYGVDKSRRFTMGAFQRLVNRTYSIYGEAFVLFGYADAEGDISLSMELFAPERIETPYDMVNDPLCRLGIQYNESGIVTGYWVRSEHPGDYRRPEYKHTFYPRYINGKVRMLQVFDPIVPEQSRGIPWLAASMNRIKDLGDFYEAELINKQVEACFGIAVEGGEMSDSPQARAERAATDTRNNGRIEEWGPGNVRYLNEGEKVSVVDPSRPGGTFQPFVELSIRSIAASLNIPYELLAKNFFRTTYSSGRLAMLDGRMGFRMRVQTLIDMWLKHVYKAVVSEVAMAGLLPVPFSTYRRNKWCFERHTWRGQNRGLLDPEKENKAHKVGLECEIETKASIAADRGENWEDNEDQMELEGRRQVEREVRLAALRTELEEQAGLPVGSSRPDAVVPMVSDDQQVESEDEPEMQSSDA